MWHCPVAIHPALGHSYHETPVKMFDSWSYFYTLFRRLARVSWLGQLACRRLARCVDPAQALDWSPGTVRSLYCAGLCRMLPR